MTNNENIVQKPKNENKSIIMIIIGILFIGLLLALLLIERQEIAKYNAECCQKICAEFNQKCRGWVQDTLECTYNYEKYGYPWVNQVFQFTINQETKDKICKTPTNNNIIINTNNTTATIN